MPSVAMMPSSRGVAREGYPFILGALGVALLFGWLLGWKVGWVGFILPGFVTFFFRDPERQIPEGADLVVSPADGKVVGICEIDDKRYLYRPTKRITIFLSVFNVHINRVPATGKVKGVFYNPGKFLMGFAEKASMDNEQNGIVLEDEKGRQIAFIQIAGWIARRIVCYLKGGESVTRGERFGLIRFGSRMDIYMPVSSELSVSVGQKVKGGETVLARLV